MWKIYKKQFCLLAYSVGCLSYIQNKALFVRYRVFIKYCVFLRPLSRKHWAANSCTIKGHPIWMTVYTQISCERISCSHTCRGWVPVNWGKTHFLMNTLYKESHKIIPGSAVIINIYRSCKDLGTPWNKIYRIVDLPLNVTVRQRMVLSVLKKVYLMQPISRVGIVQ